MSIWESINKVAEIGLRSPQKCIYRTTIALLAWKCGRQQIFPCIRFFFIRGWGNDYCSCCGSVSPVIIILSRAKLSNVLLWNRNIVYNEFSTWIILHWALFCICLTRKVFVAQFVPRLQWSRHDVFDLIYPRPVERIVWCAKCIYSIGIHWPP